MHKNILSAEQLNFLTFLKQFSRDFGLAGGTAVALHLGHRRSLDFDLFSVKEFDNAAIQKKISKSKKIQKVFVDHAGEYTVLVDGIKLTFLHYPFSIEFADKLDDFIKMPDLITLAALKAYALGRRSKWKDYVDLYFIMKNKIGLKKIIKKAEKIFGNNFNEKIFRVQLSYFKDLDYSEKVDYLPGFKMSDEKIRNELSAIAMER
jgi:Domain of unknown function (DUF1814).